MEPGFFHFTLQGLGIFTAIATIGIKVILMLRKIDKGFSIWQWQHCVMWTQFEKDNYVPPYPRLSWDDESTVGMNWLGRKRKSGPQQE